MTQNDDDITAEQFAADKLDIPLTDLPEEELVFLGVADGSDVDDGGGDSSGGKSKWEATNGHLTPTNKNGIELEEVESPDNKNLSLESDEDLVLSISGGEGAVRIETDSGHEIVLDDKSGSESITIEDRTGSNRVEMDSQSGEISISAQSKIQMDAPEIELTGDTSVDITSKRDLNMSSTGQTNLSSKGSLNLKSNGLIDVESAGITSIKGSLIQLN